METYVDERLDWRYLDGDDHEEVEALRTQINQVDDPLLGEVERLVPGVERAESVAVGGWDGFGNLVAFGWNIIEPNDERPSVHLIGGVHPAHRHKGIGRALLRWQVGAARAWRDEHRPGEDLWVGCYADLSCPGFARLLTRLEFTPERFSYDLHRDLKSVPAPRKVPGIQIVPFSDEHSEEVRVLHNICFANRGGSKNVDEESWRMHVEHPRFRPGWSFVALSSRGTVGFVLSRLDETPTLTGEPCGWTEKFGVAPEFRGRGIAVAMLSAALGAMARDGCGSAGVGVDTVDPATPAMLTEQLGYEARDGLVLYSRIEPSGVG